MSESIAITCISSGPLIEAMNNGVCVFDASHLDDPFVNAFRASSNAGQCVVAYPAEGFKRDYRKARMDDVCGSLCREGTPYRIGYLKAEHREPPTANREP